MSFDSLGIHQLLRRRLHMMQYHEPRDIQHQAITAILAGRDVVALAETGSGKTAAFGIPLAHQLLMDRPTGKKGSRGTGKSGSAGAERRLRGLVLCPTRELAQQVAAEFESITTGTVLRVACVYGKVGMGPQAKQIAAGVDLLVATPGRVRELLEAGSLSLGHVRYVVLDEADRMLDMGFLPQVEAILAHVPETRQTMLFTATMATAIEQLATRFLRDPLRLEAGQHDAVVEHVGQRALAIDDAAKTPHLVQLVTAEGRKGVIVFCRTRRRVGWVATALSRHGAKVGMIHGDRSQAQRQKALSTFASGELAVLVATDVAARGLHIPAARSIINYDVPDDPADYVHRCGRAGHDGRAGESITFVSDFDRGRWNAIAAQLEHPVDLEPGPAPPPRAPRAAATGTRTAPAKPSRRKNERTDKAAERRTAAAAPKNRKKTDDQPLTPEQLEREWGDGARREKRKRNLNPRSKASRPIKTGEKPGGGVRRLHPK